MHIIRIQSNANETELNFDQETAVITVHFIAAFICFGSGCVYMVLQSYIAFYMYPLYNNRRIGFIRGAIAAFSVVCFVTGRYFSSHFQNFLVSD